jgi:hypothetical protein
LLSGLIDPLVFPKAGMFDQFRDFPLVSIGVLALWMAFLLLLSVLATPLPRPEQKPVG